MTSLLMRLAKILIGSVALLSSLLAFWLVSSAAVYTGGPLWAVLTMTAVIVFGLPLVWEIWASTDKSRVSRSGRMLGRIATLNLLFLAAALVFQPQASFNVLGTRGDWFLDGRQGPAAAKARQAVYWSAERLESLHASARSDYGGRSSLAVPEIPDPTHPKFNQTRIKWIPTASTSAVQTTTTAVEAPRSPTTTVLQRPPRTSDKNNRWPLPVHLHPIVHSVPDNTKTYSEVAAYIAANEKDPTMRIKAIHDYITHHVSYDLMTLNALRGARVGAVEAQDPKTVFETRKAVCAGYSRLFEAMVNETGGQAVYIAGAVRSADGNAAGSSHAWNAVFIDGSWRLVDVTWDAGEVSSVGYKARYGTDFFMTPPEIFVLTHLPEHDRWQLLEKPVSRGEFVRRPVLTPRFHALGLGVVWPTRSHVSIEGSHLELQMTNPGSLYLIGVATRNGEDHRCETNYESNTVKIACELPEKGVYRTKVFGGKIRYKSHPLLASFEINRS